MKKILVVDNDPDILYAVNLILTQANFKVMTLQHANNIHYEINLFKPDLILLDILLDDADGRLICRDIKSKQHPPVVILFSANDILLQTYKDYEADGRIAKPFDIKDICNEITSYLFVKRSAIISQSVVSPHDYKTSV